MGITGEPAELDVEAYLVDSDAEMHRCAAEHWWARGIDETGRDLPLVLGFDAVRSVLRDRRLSTRSFTDDMIAAGLSERTAHQLTPLFRRHGEEHRRFRGVLSAAFTPRSVERLRPVAAAVADRLADDIDAAGGACEFVSTFAEPLPPEVFAVLFGLPVEERDRLARWASAVTDAFVPERIASRSAVIEEAAAEMRDFAAGLIAERRAVPTDDFVSGLLSAEVDGVRLSDDDVTAVISGFVFAGSETTKRQLTRAIEAFAAHPTSWDLVAADPEVIDGAVEEVLRRCSIIPGLSRVAVEAFDRDGLELDPDGRLATSFVTANLDPEAFAEPDRFDVTRSNAKEHLTFGWGPHYCLGAGLARIELQESVRALTARFGPPVLAPSGGRPDAVTTPTFGAPEVLDVRFGRR